MPAFLRDLCGFSLRIRRLKALVPRHRPHLEPPEHSPGHKIFVLPRLSRRGKRKIRLSISEVARFATDASMLIHSEEFEELFTEMEPWARFPQARCEKAVTDVTDFYDADV